MPASSSFLHYFGHRSTEPIYQHVPFEMSLCNVDVNYCILKTVALFYERKILSNKTGGTYNMNNSTVEGCRTRGPPRSSEDHFNISAKVTKCCAMLSQSVYRNFRLNYKIRSENCMKKKLCIALLCCSRVLLVDPAAGINNFNFQLLTKFLVSCRNRISHLEWQKRCRTSLLLIPFPIKWIAVT